MFGLAEIEFNKKYIHVIRFRVSAEDKKKIQKNAVEKGYSNISAFMRALAFNI